MDAIELEQVRTTLRQLIGSTPAGRVPAALVGSGWTELVQSEPATVIAVLAHEAGRARSPAPVLDVAMLWALGDPGADSTAVVVDDLVVAGRDRADRYLIASDRGPRAVPADRVTLTPVGGADPELGLCRVDAAPGDAPPFAERAAWDRAIAAGRLALASQMVGAVGQMLDETLAYVDERRQFGRPIGSFQTVKHRLADVAVAASAARAAVGTAWEAFDTAESATLAIAAKCLAGRAQRLASTHCFQVHGGIAFTAEHGFSAWVRRGQLLDLLLGSSQELTRELGRRLIDQGAVPRLPVLT